MGSSPTVCFLFIVISSLPEIGAIIASLDMEKIGRINVMKRIESRFGTLLIVFKILKWLILSLLLLS